VAIGVSAAATRVTEVSSGMTPVVFDLYSTAAAQVDTPIAYTLFVPDSSYLSASAFGGIAPSGQVTIAAGQTSAQVTVDMPESDNGTVQNENNGLQVTAPGGNLVFAPTAHTEVVNSAPEAGAPAAAELLSLSSLGTFSRVANAYTLDLARSPMASR
jgi:hypothetical protein